MNIPEKFWKLSMWVVVLLAVFLFIISVKELKSIAYVGSNLQTTNTITVEGSGDAVSLPDIATFSFTVTETSKTVSDAQAKAAEKINASLKAVKDGGVADKDIQTESYSINPHYEYQNSLCTVNSCPPSKSILTGYDVSQSISVKVRDLSKAGSLFSTIGSLGVQNVNGLAFSVDNPEIVQTEARNMAITKAEKKANDLAKQLGVSLVRITSFYESNGSTPFLYGMGGAKTMMSDSAIPAVAPQIPTGEQKITDNVTITYEIR